MRTIYDDPSITARFYQRKLQRIKTPKHDEGEGGSAGLIESNQRGRVVNRSANAMVVMTFTGMGNRGNQLKKQTTKGVMRITWWVVCLPAHLCERKTGLDRTHRGGVTRISYLTMRSHPPPVSMWMYVRIWFDAQRCTGQLG